MAGSIRSPLAFWIGGASASPSSVQAGVRSLTAPWIGGASAPSVTVQAGFLSMMALWVGGASSGAAIPVVPPINPNIFVSGPTSGRFRSYVEPSIQHNEEEEIMAIIHAFLMTRRDH